MCNVAKRCSAVSSALCAAGNVYVDTLDDRITQFVFIPCFVVLFASRFSRRRPLDYEGSGGLGLGDPRPDAQALPLLTWASRRPPLSCEVHGGDPHYGCYMNLRSTLAIVSRN